MISFDYQALPWNIVFGLGSLQRLPSELEKLGFSRALILCTPNQLDQAEKVVSLLGAAAAEVFDQAIMHVPSTTVDDAIVRAKALGVDCTVSIGGGSTTGLGKVLALKLDLPNVVIPTSYAGSEMTNIWGITENDRKVTGRDNKVVPALTIYDPDLTKTMPPEFAGPSGLNAMAQAVVNVTSGQINPIVQSMALEAVKALSQALPRVISDPTNLDAHTQALYGACMAGGSLGAGVTSLHHRLCHTFGGAFNTPHAETHTVLLPHCVAYNESTTQKDTRKLADAMGVTNAAQGLLDLAIAVGAPTSLNEIGINESDLDRASRLATESPVNNPAPVTQQGVRDLLQRAWQGSLS